MELTLQYNIGNGMWADCNERTEEFLAMTIAFTHRTREEVVVQLLAGKKLDFGQDWSAQCRNKPTPRQAAPVTTTRCDCGHTVAKSSVMSASLGTSCPDCYDRMSA